MSEPGRPLTAQEEFWAGEFGTAYIARNVGDALLAANVQFFARALRHAGSIGSCIELGANVGMNLRALRVLYPQVALEAVEINAEAARLLGEAIGAEHVHTQSLLDFAPARPADLVLVKGVLIHMAPETLPDVYGALYRSTSRFMLLAEYYNPTPVAVPYRGHADRLFKRDFAGELLDRYPDLSLRDYGFVYRRDPAFPQDDVTWFLLEKVGRDAKRPGA
jgi:pseudaminic acid biosynthesis-associated methylase